jgi:hypothetical protein
MVNGDEARFHGFCGFSRRYEIDQFTLTGLMDRVGSDHALPHRILMLVEGLDDQ